MINANLIIGAAAIIIVGVGWLASRGLSLLGGVFLNYTLIVAAVLGAITLVKGIVKPEKIRFFESTQERGNVMVAVGVFILFLFLLPRLGFLLSGYLLYGFFNWFFGKNRASIKSILVSALLSFIIVTGFYLVFHYLLNIPLPAGQWFDSP